MMMGFQQQGLWDASARESNMLDGGAHFYDTYECSDGKFISIGSIEPQFYALLLEKLGIDDAEFADQNNRALWPALKTKMAAVIAGKTRDEWCAVMEGTDVCFAPVLTMVEATQYAPNNERSVYVEVDGVTHPAPAPRFSRTPSRIAHGTRAAGADSRDVLASVVGLETADIDALLECGAIVQA